MSPPEMHVTLREADADDLVAIHKIRRQAILGITPGPFSIDEIRAWADKRTPDYFAPRLLRNEVLIARSETGPVAWGSCQAGKIEGLYVLPSAGRSGVGRLLMDAMESQIADRGYPTAGLWASRNAVGFYERLGFRTMKIHEDGSHSMLKDLHSSPLPSPSSRSIE